ncbi:hypothetical protein M422DRAFT_41071 [Sphaerobolus stellatus SS14]|nr:hypothetical protein M422DRAFT_41071 [Sphaerobolus stellatus SS14]
MPRISVIAVIMTFLLGGHSARTFIIINNCHFTVWCDAFENQKEITLNFYLIRPAIYSNMPLDVTGWEAGPGNTTVLSVPNDWQSGRIWGRRDCATPATLGEWTLAGGTGLDNYDGKEKHLSTYEFVQTVLLVSVVDGFNLPMRIETNPKANCSIADCPADVDDFLSQCPDELKGPTNPSGTILGCKSACAAGLAPDQTSMLLNTAFFCREKLNVYLIDSPDCCTGSHNTPATCPPTGVQYYSFFKNNCKNSYVYAYDESSHTALWTCDSTNSPGYTLTFCPASLTMP